MTDLDVKRRAAELLQKGRYDEAVEEYQALLGQAKKPNPAILNLIGDIYCKQQNYEKGFEAFLRAARAYTEEGLFHNAIAVGKKVLRLDREQTDVYAMLGSLYARQGLGMDCVKFLSEYARRKDAAGEYPAALAAFADACEKLSDFGEIHAVYGDMLERVDRIDEAIEAYHAAEQSFSDRGRMDLASKWASKAKRLRNPEEEEAKEEAVSGMMGLRSLSDDAPTEGYSDGPFINAHLASPRGPNAPSSEPVWDATGESDALTLEIASPTLSAAMDAPAFPAATPSGATPWRPYDPQARPELPKPPPLPPRKKKAEPVLASMNEDTLTFDRAPEVDFDLANSATTTPSLEMPALDLSSHETPTLAMPRADLNFSLEDTAVAAPHEIVFDVTLDSADLQSEAAPAPEEDMTSAILEDPLRGSIRDLKTESGSHEMPTKSDPARLREFFEDSPASVEQAVVIGDDFELVREGGDVLEVIADFREATREILDLDDHQSHYDLGMTYLEMELFDDAVAEFEIASRGNDFALQSQEMLGTCFLRKGQIELAIHELEKALALPGYDERDRLGIHYNLGIACGVTDREQEAIEHFQKILEIDPNFRDTRTRLERLVSSH